MPTIRLAENADLPGLMPRVEEFYQLFELPWDASHKRAVLEELLRSPELGQLWLVCEGPEVLGYALVAFWFSLEFNGRTALLDELYLAPETRGRGLGNTVLEHLETTLRASGFHRLRLEVDGNHPRAAVLYARRGYTSQNRTLWGKNLG